MKNFLAPASILQKQKASLHEAVMRRCLFIVVFLLVDSATILSQTTNEVGPYGGYINCLTRDGGNVYAGTYLGGVFRTSNNGDTWQRIYNDSVIIDARSVALNSNGHIFIGADPGFFRSTDGGASWQKINNALNTRTTVSLRVLGNGNILAGTLQAGVYRSTDNGTTFTQINNGLSSSFVRSIAVNSINGYLFAATVDQGVFRSTNDGANWTQADSGITQLQMNWVGVSPSFEVYATGGTAIFRSTNNGNSWTNLSAPSSAAYWELAFTPAAIYAAAQNSTVLGGGVYRSTDNGTTWAQEPGLPNIVFQRIDAMGNTVLAGCLGFGVYRSSGTDSPTDTWMQVVNGMTNTHIVSIVSDASGDDYTAIQMAGVFRSTDGGQVWLSASNGIPATERLTSLAVSPTTGTLFAGGSYGGYRSTNQGSLWTSHNNMNSATVAKCNSRGHVFAASGAQVRRTTNDGSTWTFTNLSQVSNVADFAFDGDTVYAATGVGSGFGTSRGVYRSTDNGNTWNPFNNGLTDLNVIALATLVGGSFESPSEIDCQYTVRAATPTKIVAYEKGSWVEELSSVSPARLVSTTTRADDRVWLTETRGKTSHVIFPSCQWDPKSGVALSNEVRSIQIIRNGADYLAQYGTFGGGIVNIVFHPSGVNNGDELVTSFSLAQNYPNPFNPTTKIAFSIPVGTHGHTSLRVFDLLGREVATLVNEQMKPGDHERVFDAGSLAGGVYFYRLEAGNFTGVRKLLLLK